MVTVADGCSAATMRRLVGDIAGNTGNVPENCELVERGHGRLSGPSFLLICSQTGAQVPVSVFLQAQGDGTF